jgi:cytochrome c oxidase subunit 3
MAELYDSNILTSGQGAVGDDPGELVKGTDPHAPNFGKQQMHGDHDDHHAHDGLVVHHFMDLAQQREAGTLGMWIFLATEVMFIGAIFVAYFSYRIQHEFFTAFRHGSENLIMWVGFVNTLVLLTSSLTVVLAIRAAQLGEKKWVLRHLIATFVLGWMFFGFKVYEYTTDYREHLWPGLTTVDRNVNPSDTTYPDWTPQLERAGAHYFLPEKHFIQELFPKNPDGTEIGFEKAKDEITQTQLVELHRNLDHAKLFYRFYYSLTGLHAFHMLVGLGIFSFLIVKAWMGKFTPESHQQIEICGLYWHFVDIVWIFLFPLLYLVR